MTRQNEKIPIAVFEVKELFSNDVTAASKKDSAGYRVTIEVDFCLLNLHEFFSRTHQSEELENSMLNHL
jgi:hypothetical protein